MGRRCCSIGRQTHVNGLVHLSEACQSNGSRLHLQPARTAQPKKGSTKRPSQNLVGHPSLGQSHDSGAYLEKARGILKCHVAESAQYMLPNNKPTRHVTLLV